MQRKPGGYRKPSEEQRRLSMMPKDKFDKWFQQFWTITGASVFSLRLGRGENSPKISRIEPLNRRKTSNTQHPTSNNQWFPIGPLIGGWVLDVGCWMIPRVHGEGLRARCRIPKHQPLPTC